MASHGRGEGAKRSLTWDLGRATSTAALAANRTDLFKLNTLGGLERRPSYSQWRWPRPRFSQPGLQVMAVDGETLWGITDDDVLLFRHPLAFGEPFLVASPQPSIGYRSMTAADGNLYALTVFGLVWRPARALAGT